MKRWLTHWVQIWWTSHTCFFMSGLFPLTWGQMKLMTICSWVVPARSSKFTPSNPARGYDSSNKMKLKPHLIIRDTTDGILRQKCWDIWDSLLFSSTFNLKNQLFMPRTNQNYDVFPPWRFCWLNQTTLWTQTGVWKHDLIGWTARRS